MMPSKGSPTSLPILLTLALGLAAAEQMSQKPETFPLVDISFHLTQPLKFRGKVVSGVLKKSEIGPLLDLPVRNGIVAESEEGYGVEMTGERGGRFLAATCNQWKKAVAEKSYAATTFDMAMESFMVHTCGLLFELQHAVPAERSFVKNVKLSDLGLVPEAILLTFGEDEDPKPKGKPQRDRTVTKVVSSSKIQVTSGDSVKIQFGGLDQFFQEAARADFNHDSIEDILVIWGAKAVGGTAGFSGYVLLTRLGPTGTLKVIDSQIKQSP